MLAVLSVSSFLISALLAAYIPASRVRCNVGTLAIVLWLSVGNLIHGINAIEWAGNVDMSAPVWCDIVTRFVLAIYMSLPAACICISRELERISSRRKISKDIRSVHIRALVDILICYIIPSLYLLLHYIVQSRRFDIIKDYGCFASIHSSGLTSLIIYLPPVFSCCISLLFTGLTLRNLLRLHLRTAQHISDRSAMTLSQFYRHLAMSLLMTTAIVSFIIVSVASMPILEPWTSFAQVHAHITEINIVNLGVPSQITALQKSWWGVFTLSVVYLFLLVILGEETRNIYWGLVVRVSKFRRGKVQPPLSLYLSDKSRSISPQRPESLELRSGWDDMPEFNSLLCNFSRRNPATTSKSHSMKTRDTSSPSSSTTPMLISSLVATPHHSPNSSLRSISMTTEDREFMSNTLEYLEFPTARSPGIPIPSPAHVPPMKNSHAGLNSSFDTGSSRTQPVAKQLRVPTKMSDTGTQPVRAGADDAVSTISSVCKAAWPVPPVLPPTLSSRYKAPQ